MLLLALRDFISEAISFIEVELQSLTTPQEIRILSRLPNLVHHGHELGDSGDEYRIARALDVIATPLLHEVLDNDHQNFGKVGGTPSLASILHIFVEISGSEVGVGDRSIRALENTLTSGHQPLLEIASVLEGGEDLSTV